MKLVYKQYDEKEYSGAMNTFKGIENGQKESFCIEAY